MKFSRHVVCIIYLERVYSSRRSQKHPDAPLVDFRCLCIPTLRKRELLIKAFKQELPNSSSIRILRVERIRGIEIAMPERGARKPLAVALVDDPVLGALVSPSRPRLDHIPAVNNVDILESGDSEPVLRLLVPYL